MENFHTNVKSLFHSTLSYGVFNFCLGVCHIVMEDYYKDQLTALICVDMGYMIVLFWSIRLNDIYYLKYVGWQNILASLLRILLIITFSIDKDVNHDSGYICNQIQTFIVIVYIVNWIFAIFIGYFLIIFWFGKILITNLGLCVSKIAA